MSIDYLADVARQMATLVTQVPYDPAIAANVISIIAMIVAGRSYRLTKRAEIAKRDALLPDVGANMHLMKKHPGWYAVSLTIQNNFDTDLHVTGIKLKKPVRAKGIDERAAMEPDRTGNTSLVEIMPLELAARSFSMKTRMASAGTSRSHHGINPGDRAWPRFCVYLGDSPRSEALIFDVEFATRLSDIRRRDRHVSTQNVIVPPKQTS